MPDAPRVNNFNVSIQGILETNRGVNFNIQVQATDVVDALKQAVDELGKLLNGAGLSVSPPVSSPAPTLPPTAA